MADMIDHFIRVNQNHPGNGRPLPHEVVRYNQGRANSDAGYWLYYAEIWICHDDLLDLTLARQNLEAYKREPPELRNQWMQAEYERLFLLWELRKHEQRN